MKKKRAKKLMLHKETVLHLEEPSLRQVAGASWGCSAHTFCVTDCPYCPWETYTEPSAFTVCDC